MGDSMFQEQSTTVDTDCVISTALNRASWQDFSKNTRLGTMPYGRSTYLTSSFFEADKNGDVWIDLKRVLGKNIWVSGDSALQWCLDRLDTGEFVCTDNYNSSVADVLIAKKVDTKGKTKLLRHNINVFIPEIYYSKKELMHFYSTFKGYGMKIMITEDGFVDTSEYDSRKHPKYVEVSFTEPLKYDGAFFIGNFIRYAMLSVMPSKATTKQTLMRTLTMALKAPLEDMPLYINEEHWLKKGIAKWRLEVCK
jgi:hypothetical protein